MSEPTESQKLAEQLRGMSKGAPKEMAYLYKLAAYTIDDLEGRAIALREVNHELRRDLERESTARRYADKARAETQSEVQRAAREFETIRWRTEATEKVLADNIDSVQRALFEMVRISQGSSCECRRADHETEPFSPAPSVWAVVDPSDSSKILDIDFAGHAAGCTKCVAMMGLFQVLPKLQKLEKRHASTEKDERSPVQETPAKG